ncbi:hypothetical protein FGO68_gene5590 [Halteria grandinella]|uniref:Uncharacterized protein n=1 Tax=Halteria grandinella TaxID=5974 RepID=A0A8J8T9P8_HALGN|nr:hypothetical protein FGO68_gene5590 [Halteria grandinella]
MDPSTSYTNMSPFSMYRGTPATLSGSRNNSFTRNPNQESSHEIKPTHKKLFQRPGSQLDDIIAPKAPVAQAQRFESMYASLYQNRPYASNDFQGKDSRFKNQGSQSHRSREKSIESTGSRSKYKNMRNYSQIELGGEFITYQQQYFESVKMPTGKTAPAQVASETKPTQKKRVVSNQYRVANSEIPADEEFGQKPPNYEPKTPNCRITSARVVNQRQPKIVIKEEPEYIPQTKTFVSPQTAVNRTAPITPPPREYDDPKPRANDDSGMKSFVDILTIDYRKTLNDYKNKMMEEARRKAVSSHFSSGSLSSRELVSNRQSEQSFVECLKGDHMKQTYNKKFQLRQSAVASALESITHGNSEREKQKDKLMGRAEVGGTVDFVDILTGDHLRSTRNSSVSKEGLLDAWKNQMQVKNDQIQSAKEKQKQDDQMHLSFLQQKEEQEKLTQRVRSDKAKTVQQEALKQYESEKDKKIYAKRLQQIKERDALKGAQNEQVRRNEELKKVVESNVNERASLRIVKSEIQGKVVRAATAGNGGMSSVLQKYLNP